MRENNNIDPAVTNELADGVIATLLKRFPKKWGAQIKRACEDSFTELVEGKCPNTTYSIRSGRLLYLCIPKWEDLGVALSLSVEVIYMRANARVAIPGGAMAVPPLPVPGDAAFIGPLVASTRDFP